MVAQASPNDAWFALPHTSHLYSRVMNVTHLNCSFCDKEYEAGKLHNLCGCGKPLMVAYDLDKAASSLTRQSLKGRDRNLWRYREVLPVDNDENVYTLGEGMTPLAHARRLGDLLGMRRLFIKDESLNPTASFKARGMAVAVSMAKELGVPLPPTQPRPDYLLLSSCQKIRRGRTSSSANRWVPA
jgi:threonine synthase